MRSLGYKVPILTEIVRYNRLQNPPVRTQLLTIATTITHRPHLPLLLPSKEGTWPDENGMLEVLMTNHENIIRHICNERCVSPLHVGSERKTCG